MEFHPYQTMMDEYVRADRSRRKMDLFDLYRAEMTNIATTNFRNMANKGKRMLRLGIELGWMREGRPYYNVHPQMVRSLMKANLDQIPANMIEIPDFTAMCFRFAEPVPLRVQANTGVHLITDDSLADMPIGARSVLISWFPKDEQRKAASSIDDFDSIRLDDMTLDDDAFIIAVDEGLRTDMGPQDGGQRMLCNLYTLTVKDGETIPQAIDRTIDRREGGVESVLMQVKREQLLNMFKVIITTGFLADSPEDRLVTPDILSKDRQQYAESLRKGDVDTQKRIEARARNRKGLGWNVGTSEMFLGNMGRMIEDRSSSGTGGSELEFSHLRGGHPHAVRYGPGKKKVKIKWFRPTRVRPDLEFKQDD